MTVLTDRNIALFLIAVILGFMLIDAVTAFEAKTEQLVALAGIVTTLLAVKGVQGNGGGGGKQ